MTEPTLSTRLRSVQDQLNAVNTELTVVRADAIHLGLAPHRVAGIQAAIHDNEHAWNELNTVATALELTGAHHKP